MSKRRREADVETSGAPFVANATSNGKRLKRPKSCIECRRMKQKCSRDTWPCSNCVKRDLGHVCPGGSLLADAPRKQLLEENNRLTLELEDMRAKMVHIPQRRREESPWGLFSRSSTSRRQNSDPSLERTRPTDASVLADLPGRARAEAIISNYFGQAVWLHEVLDEAEFRRESLEYAYRAADMPNQDHLTIDTQRLSQVILVLSLGSLFDPSQPPFCKEAGEWFAIACDLLCLDTAPTHLFMQNVQIYGSIILNGGPLITSGESFWPLVELTMRMAVSHNYHRMDATSTDENEAFRRSKLFWELYSYDLIQSMSQARPCALPLHAIDAPLPFKAYRPDETSFHHQKLLLSRIIYKINDLQIRVMSPSLDLVAGINSEIQAFVAALPPDLACSEADLWPTSTHDADQTSGWRPWRLKVVIHLLINEAIFFLHRLSFSAALAETPLEPLDGPHGQSFAAHIAASQNILYSVSALVLRGGQNVWRRWHIFYHAYAACTSLAAGVLNAPTSRLTQDILESLKLGVNLFIAANRTDAQRLVDLHSRARQTVEGMSQIKDQWIPAGSSQEAIVDPPVTTESLFAPVPAVPDPLEAASLGTQMPEVDQLFVQWHNAAEGQLGFLWQEWGLE